MCIRDRVTKHRTSVLRIIVESKQPISAEEIYLKLKENSISINLSSIYKILDSLSNKNIISKCILGDDNKTSYEITSSTHMHHLICKQCKEVLDVYKRQTLLYSHIDYIRHIVW